jgi:hypothetical protein
MLKTRLTIQLWLSKRKITQYMINSDLTVDVNTSVDLRPEGRNGLGEKLTHIPIQFGVVSGNFNCSDNDLTSLSGAPHYVGNNFHCLSNKIESYEYLPKKVGGNLICDGKIDIKDLLTIEVGGQFCHQASKKSETLEIIHDLYQKKLTVPFYSISFSLSMHQELMRIYYEKTLLEKSFIVDEPEKQKNKIKI